MRLVTVAGSTSTRGTQLTLHRGGGVSPASAALTIDILGGEEVRLTNDGIEE